MGWKSDRKCLLAIYKEDIDNITINMIYPPHFPSHKNEPAEEQVYNILKTLDPERYDVFYDRKFSGMRPGEKKDYQIDFLIADLKGGRFNALLVLEVKGGVVKYNGQDGCWVQNGRIMKGNSDPIEQATGNMHNLLKHYPEISGSVPFEWAVCFPDPRNMYSRKQMPPSLANLQLIESMALGNISKHLPVLFRKAKEAYPWLKGTDTDTYRIFRDSLLAGLGMAVPLHTRFAAEERRLIKLTEDQVRLLDLVSENHNLQITGPAGCGKTVMATTIAREARQQGLKVLMLTFNRIPAANIRSAFGLNGEEEDIIIDNYHHFAHMQVEKLYPGWWVDHVGVEEFWSMESAIKLDEVLQKSVPHFDVLIIDEGQDFREMWYESLEHALKPGGRYYVFMDEDQDIFDAFTRLPAGREFVRFSLPHNCRNTVRIIERLEGYIDKKIPYPEGTPEGEPVRFYSYRNDIDQARIVKDEWLRMVRDEAISPDRIVILLNTPLEQSCLRGMKGFGNYPIAMISKDTGQTSTEHVNVANIRNFKGLEADVVFILDTDKMENQDRRVWYTQVSRARLWLGVMEKIDISK